MRMSWLGIGWWLWCVWRAVIARLCLNIILVSDKENSCPMSKLSWVRRKWGENKISLSLFSVRVTHFSSASLIRTCEHPNVHIRRKETRVYAWTSNTLERFVCMRSGICSFFDWVSMTAIDSLSMISLLSLSLSLFPLAPLVSYVLLWKEK